jgi:15-cis-phytoene synthase
MVDAPVLGAGPERGAGSSPAPGIAARRKGREPTRGPAAFGAREFVVAPPGAATPTLPAARSPMLLGVRPGSDSRSTTSSGADAAHCERVTRAHARTFALASWLLPAEKRRAAFALYAFCRVADDMVDRADETGAPGVAAQLARYRRDLDAALAGRADAPVFRELARVAREFAVPATVLHELLDGVERDLRPVRYRDWEELALYCEGVASSVGEMCTHVFGVAAGPLSRDGAIRHARTLGVAMQLTNILRDVGEDAERGRCYLPDEDLATFGLRAEDVLARRVTARDERWRALMAFEARRARALYEAAIPGIALLAPDSQGCAAACARGYAAILDVLERTGWDSLTARASVGGWDRLLVLYDAWRDTRRGRGGADLAPVAGGPVIEWGGARMARAHELVKLA